MVSHLVTVDAFWMSSLRAAHTRATPTTFIRGFDPSTGTDVFVDPMLELPTDVILQQLVDGTEAFVTTVESLDADDWDAPGEAPFGHLPARCLLAHAFWDSWLHERDILLPLGWRRQIEPDEVLAATWYTLVVGGVQGGLLDDPEPVGPGAEAPIDVTLRFDEVSRRSACACEIDTGVAHHAGGRCRRGVRGSRSTWWRASPAVHRRPCWTRYPQISARSSGAPRRSSDPDELGDPRYVSGRCGPCRRGASRRP